MQLVESCEISGGRVIELAIKAGLVVHVALKPAVFGFVEAVIVIRVGHSVPRSRS